MKRALSVFMFVLLLVSMSIVASNIQSFEGSETIATQADGMIDPTTALANARGRERMDI